MTLNHTADMRMNGDALAPGASGTFTGQVLLGGRRVGIMSYTRHVVVRLGPRRVSPLAPPVGGCFLRRQHGGCA